jgi:uncharacterized protein Yka (UPF0111/DUF47 family)
VIETSIKALINVALGGAAIATLVHLVPHAQAQADRLQEMQAEVKHVEGRVDQLRTSFQYYFDPHQTQNVMQELGHRVDPQQYPVVLLKPESAVKSVDQR